MYWDNVLKEIRNKKSNQQFFAFTNLNALHAKNDTKLAKATPRPKPKRYYLGKKYPQVYFTRREAECMLLLIHGKTIKEAAKIIGLSYRTVEFYLKNMKIKLNCNSRSQLIGQALDSDFLQQIDF